MNDKGDILVGSRGGEIFEFRKGEKKPEVRMRSHCQDELWGLATNPNP